jgi:hypothetical protein
MTVMLILVVVNVLAVVMVVITVALMDAQPRAEMDFDSRGGCPCNRRSTRLRS